MPLIKCPDCANAVSDSAVSCVHCGCLLKNRQTVGTVKITFPEILESGISMYPTDYIIINDKNDKRLWIGTVEESAEFEVVQPTEISIYFGPHIPSVRASVFPNKKYIISKSGKFSLPIEYELLECK